MELGLNNYYSFIGLASSQIQMNKRNIMMISIHGDPTAEIGSEEQGGQPMKKKIVEKDSGVRLHNFTKYKTKTKKR